MSQLILFVAQLILVTGLLTVHLFAFQHDLYWHYLWLDLPMHFLGGLWAGLAVTWGLRFVFGRASFLPTFAGILAIGIGWEVFEYVVGFQRETNYALDTGIDIVLDSLGGVLGYFATRLGVRDTMTANAENQNHSS